MDSARCESRGFANAELGGRQGMAQVVALNVVTSKAKEECALLLGLHSLGDDFLSSACAIATMAVVMAAEPSSDGRSLTKDRSIFTTDTSKRLRYAKEE